MLRRALTYVSSSFGVLALVALFVWGIRFYGDVGWTGFKDKALWDLLELLLIPAVIAGIGVLFNVSERRVEREIARDRSMDDAMHRYLDRIGDLILNVGLGLNGGRLGSAVSRVAEARTRSLLTSLDPVRLSIVVQFLSRSDLIQGSDAPIPLAETDLNHVDFRKADLSRADLSNVNLSEANLTDANLSEARLIEANLVKADLNRAVLYRADLSNADLSLANLQSAVLVEADLRCADLKNADLRRVQLIGADLSGADLTGARLIGASGANNVQLAQAASLRGVTLPDGTKIETEDQWQEFKAKYEPKK